MAAIVPPTLKTLSDNIMKKTTATALNSTWLNGKYKNGEINTALPYIAYKDFFVQGEDANEFINEVYAIWTSYDITTEQAFEKWANQAGL